MPAEILDNNNLVIWSGVMIILIGAAGRFLDQHTEGNKFWLTICNSNAKKSKFPMLFQLQVLHLSQPSVGPSMVLPLFSANGLLSRLTSIFLGFAPTFLLLSIGYEAVFYGAFALVLMAWILFENTLIYSSKVKRLSSSFNNMEDDAIVDGRYLELSDIRIPLIFPFLMAALLIFKLFIPFLLVICVFNAITKLNRLLRLGCYFLVLFFSDVMTMHFFFLVQNTGSWMEIGNSISHFGIMSAQVVFVLLLFALTNVYTKDIFSESNLKLSFMFEGHLLQLQQQLLIFSDNWSCFAICDIQSKGIFQVFPKGCTNSMEILAHP
ncbi:GPI ethanolamine phosphate transferase 1 [Rosa chinensis]|uniref:GPI ethanolamine phosphate transferase 1 n=1 Tax=Rosa chinensis TaxID=74649 RepID=UPI001AD9318A|nr:GPI ethanolamine phosphate transferase 1 [Rosa chinensis]